MTQAATESASPPEFPTTLGHPRPLWMLFMTEFWERFAFYGIRWALVLYIVAQFFGGDPTGEQPASRTYGAYLALVYASAIFGGYVADRVLGYQRSILVGAAVMATGLFLIAFPEKHIFELGLATVIVGNGLFKPNISTMVGKLYGVADERRDSGFTIFYMGINMGALIAPVITEYLAKAVFGSLDMPSYKVVFMASGVGMIISLFWFWFGRRGLQGVGRPAPEAASRMRVVWVLLGIVVAVPLVYLLLAFVGANGLQWLLGLLFIGVAAMLIVEALRHDRVQLHRVYAMLIIFAFNILFWMFYFQLGTSFNFLAANMVDRQMFGGWEFPVGWFQSVSPLAIILLAPLVTQVWALLARRRKEPSIPRKFGLGLLFNGLGFTALMYALTYSIDSRGLIPFWPLTACYVLQTIGELCLSPIGLSMVTKLAPPRLVGLAMGGWFLSLAVGGNLSGLLAGRISGESGMTAASALSGFTFSFWLLAGAGVFLLLISPLINRLMHGVR